MAKYGKLCDEKKVKNDLGAFEDKMFLINSVLGKLPFPVVDGT